MKGASRRYLGMRGWVPENQSPSPGMLGTLGTPPPPGRRGRGSLGSSGCCWPAGVRPVLLGRRAHAVFADCEGRSEPRGTAFCRSASDASIRRGAAPKVITHLTFHLPDPAALDPAATISRWLSASLNSPQNAASGVGPLLSASSPASL